jgi:hypothetical protein
MIFRPTSAAVLAVSMLGAATAALLPATPAAAGDCTKVPSTSPTGIVDIEGDGIPDTAVGVPGFISRTHPAHAAAGAVDLRLSSGRAQLLTPTRLGVGSAQTGARFGAAVALGDLSGDNCADLAVGEPGTSSVYLLNGGPTGILATGAQTLHGTQAGDQFGATVVESATTSTNDPNPGARGLWIGAPGTDVAGVVDAGAIYHYTVPPKTGVPVLLEVLTEQSPVIGETPHAGDRFGEVLAANFDGIYVGRPHHDVNDRPDAGALTSLRVDQVTGLVSEAQTLTQDSPGVPNTAEAGDRFGASVYSGGGSLVAVGAPGEDLGAKPDAGLVQLFVAISGKQLTPGRALTQSSPRVPGKAEAGDRFGASVLTSDASTLCDRAPEEDGRSVIIGSPGEDVGKAGHIRNAGSVTVLDFTFNGADAVCAAKPLVQGRALPGQAERGDMLGQTLGAIRAAQQSAEDYAITTLVGVPGEDLRRSADAGIFEVVSHAAGTQGHFRFPATATGFVGGRTAGLRFGSVFAQFQVGST